MEAKVKEHVRQVLDNYLEASGGRKTPERYAILDAVYSQKGHFTLDALNSHLLADNFRVSRATMFNTMKLFMALRLVVKHVLPEGTFYEAGYGNGSHCHQVCTQCGKAVELRLPEIGAAVDGVRLKRFRKEGFVLYIYGICSSCQAKMTRRIKEQKNVSKNKDR